MKNLSVLLISAVFLIATPALATSEVDAEQKTFGQKVDETLERFRSYSSERRDEAVAAGKELLEVLDQRIDRLQQDAGETADDAREASKEEIRELKELRASVAECLEKAGKETASTWGRFKSAVGDAVSAFRDRMKEE